MQKHFEASRTFKESKLEAFVEPARLDFDNLLRAFLNAGRLKRAKDNKDNELTIQKETDERVEAVLREYHIVIDFEGRTILHDCADWSKMLSSKKFCKHIGKLLLSLKREKAARILRQIYGQKETWQFKPYT